MLESGEYIDWKQKIRTWKITEMSKGSRPPAGQIISVEVNTEPEELQPMRSDLGSRDDDT